MAIIVSLFCKTRQHYSVWRRVGLPSLSKANILWPPLCPCSVRRHAAKLLCHRGARRDDTVWTPLHDAAKLLCHRGARRDSSNGHEVSMEGLCVYDGPLGAAATYKTHSLSANGSRCTCTHARV